MKLNPIGPNQTEIERGDKTVFYSYQTPVAVFVPGQGALVTTRKYSQTTSKHINKAVARWGATRKEVSQDEINKLSA